MEKLDKGLFTQVFKKFNDDLLAYNGIPFQSFSTGVPEKWEGYKPVVRRIAIERLRSNTWTENDIGSSRIFLCILDAIEIKENTDVRNNLVPWEPRHNRPSETDRLREELGSGPTRQRFERHMFDLFRKRREPGEIFEEVVSLIGRRYSLIAYLFYVFDDTNFLPIGTRTFDRAFDKIGVSVRTTARCSWANYQDFIEAIRSVQAALTTWMGVKDVALIDAHSYLWLVVRLPEEILKRRSQGVRGPGDLKAAMIGLAQGVFSRISSANGQTIERIMKNKELIGFSSVEEFYDYLCRLWEEQDGRCNLTGLPMLLPQKGRAVTELVASIDRKDSARHYEPNNIQLTCWFANRWKGTQSDAEFSKLVDIIRRGEDAQNDHPLHFGILSR